MQILNVEMCDKSFREAPLVTILERFHEKKFNDGECTVNNICAVLGITAFSIDKL